jgi:hypothetical protein
LAKRKLNILESRVIERADDFLDGEEGYKTPSSISFAYKELKKEVRRLQRISDDTPVASIKKKPVDNGHHPAVTGLSVGGAKELLDWILAIATENDRYGQEFLQLSFVDGGITAIIAATAAWLAKGSSR